MHRLLGERALLAYRLRFTIQIKVVDNKSDVSVGKSDKLFPLFLQVNQITSRTFISSNELKMERTLFIRLALVEAKYNAPATAVGHSLKKRCKITRSSRIRMTLPLAVVFPLMKKKDS